MLSLLATDHEMASAGFTELADKLAEPDLQRV